MDRRTALQILAAAPSLVAADYKLLFFTPEENVELDAIAERIVPGARAVRASLHVDLVVANSGRDVQARWRERLTAFQAEAGARFSTLNASQQAAVLDRVSENEAKPTTDAERFFADIKRATLFAYYTSKQGIREELGFLGNAVHGEFKGCTHPAGTHRAG